MIILAFQLLLLAYGFLAMGRAYAKVALASPPGGRPLILLGLLLLAGWPAAWALQLSDGLVPTPITGALRDSASTLLGRGGEYALGAAIVLLGLAWFAWSAFALLRDARQLRSIRDSALDLEALDDPEWGNLAELRAKLEAKYRASTGFSNLSFRVSDAIRTPFTIGVWKPDIYAPLWMFSESSGTHLRLLLDLEADRLRRGYGWPLTLLRVLERLLPFARPLIRGLCHRLEGAADQAFQSTLAEADRRRFREALQHISKIGREGDPEVPFGWARGLDVARPGTARGLGASAWTFLLAGFVSTCLAATVVLGPVPFHSLRGLMTRELPSGVVFLPYSADARAVAIPGRGGDLPDGVLVDTTRVKNSRCHLDFPYWTQRPELFRSQGETFVRLRMDVEAIPRRSASPGILLECLVTLWREDALGQARETLPLEQDVRVLPPGHSTQDIVLALNPARPFPGHLVLSGPSFRIPPGWRLKVTHLSATPATAAQWHPKDLAAASRLMEAWRQQAGAPHTLNLDWFGER